MKIRIQARVIAYDAKEKSILLVRNPNAGFWYVPGGGLEEGEDIMQCAVREVREETGLHVRLKRLLYVQELHDEPDALVIMELFWLAELAYAQTLNPEHIDVDPEGGIAEAKWFTQGQLQHLTVYPETLKDTFWQNIGNSFKAEDPFLGVLT